MSEEKKTVAMPQKKSGKKTGKTIGWFIGIIVLILISVTFVLPSTMFAGDTSSGAVNFGKYDGENIDMTYDSYFYFQLQNAYSNYASYYGEDNVGAYIYNIYYTAYQAAVLNARIQKMANQVGIKPTNAQITEAVVNSGAFSDGTSTYSSEVYANATDMTKAQVVSWMQDAVTSSAVQQDISYARVSKAETDFIVSMSADKKAFDYMVLSPSLYPDEEAIAYAEANPALFQTMSFTRATFATEEEAAAALAEVAAGTKTMADLAEASIDSSASNGGVVEGAYRFSIENYLAATETSATATELYEAAVDTLVGPVKTSEGYTLFLVTEAAQAFDASKENATTAVKSYLTSYLPDTIKGYLESLASQVYAEAQVDFEKAAEKYGAYTASVSAVAKNTADSQFVYSFNYTDVGYDSSFNTVDGYIYTAAKNDAAYEDQLFSSAVGTVLAPVYSKSAYVIVKVAEPTTDNSETIVSAIESMYPSYAPQYTLVDFQSATLNDGKLEDNFVAGFLKAAYGM